MAILPVISLLYAMFALSMASEAMTDGGSGETEESSGQIRMGNESQVFLTKEKRGELDTVGEDRERNQETGEKLEKQKEKLTALSMLDSTQEFRPELPSLYYPQGHRPVLLTVEGKPVCRDGWHSCGNRCFGYFHGCHLTWSEAEGYCVSQGSNLVSIHNEAEARCAGAVSGNENAAWIGAGGCAESLTWYWTDCSPFDYSNWAPWEPNNNGGNEHCAATNFHGGGIWNDLPCHKHLPFVCAY